MHMYNAQKPQLGYEKDVIRFVRELKSRILAEKKIFQTSQQWRRIHIANPKFCIRLRLDETTGQ